MSRDGNPRPAPPPRAGSKPAPARCGVAQRGKGQYVSPGRLSILSWRTLWGANLPGSPVPPSMVTAVAILSLALSLAGLLGFDFGLGRAAAAAGEGGLRSGPALASFVHVALEGTAGLFALVVALFALFRVWIDRRWALAAPVAVWGLVGLLDLFHASLELTLPLAAPQRPQALAFTWLVSRLFLGLALLVAAWSPPRSEEGSPRDLRSSLAVLALGVVALAVSVSGGSLGLLPSLLQPGWVVARPGDLVPLALFLAGGLWFFPRYHRARPSIFSYALLISALPQLLAQVHMAFGARALYDSHFLAAHGQRLLAYLVVLGGFALDYGRVYGRERDAVREAETVQIALTEKSREMERLDRERDHEAEERQRAERTLRMLDKAVETMSQGLTITDLTGRIIYVNPADARMHGYRVEELLGQSSWVFNAERVRTPLPRPPELSRWERERLNIRKDGTTFPVRLISDVVLDDEGRQVAVVTLCEDISERRRIREALERRDRILQAVSVAAERFLSESPWEERVGEVLERLGLATGVDHVYVGRVHAAGGPAHAEPAHTWTAVDAELVPAVSSGGNVLMPPYLLEGWRQRLARGQILRGRVEDLPRMERSPLLARGVRSYAVVPIFVQSAWWGFLGLEASDPRREWSRAEIDALRAASRTLAAAIHRQQTIEALEASEEQYREVLENANDLIQSVAPDGRFQYVNRAWREALGYSEGEVRRLTLGDIVASESLPAYREVVRRIVAGEQRGRVEATFVSRDGREIPVEGNLNCRLMAAKVVSIRGIFRDISERKAIDRLKQEFISTISHDLRTPLTSVIAALGLLESGRAASDAERTAELLAVAQRNSNRLMSLINDLLDLQRLSAGKMRFKLAGVRVQPFLAEAAEGIKAFADSSGVQLEVGDPTPELEVLADRDRLMQVMNNLLSNAIKHSPSGGAVFLGAAGGNGRVVFSVADRGPGIPAHFRERLFERFSQADPSGPRRTGGSGLGLSIVKALVEGMKGEVTFESAEGKGTTFFVSLPAP